MLVKCKNNDGFEDQFTVGELYLVSESKNNSYYLANDNSCLRWYGTVHFTID